MSSISAPSTLLAPADTPPASTAPPPLRPAAGAPDGPSPALRRWSRRERALIVALLASIALHLAGGSGALDWLSGLYQWEEPEHGPPLRTVLKPPPPPVFTPAVEPPAPAPKAKPKPKHRTPPPVVATRKVEAEPVVPVEVIAPEPPSAVEAAPVPTRAAPPAAVEPPPAVADVAAEPAPVEEAVPPAPVVTVPKRIDLVGTLYLGAQNFMVGTGGFSLRHDGNRYEISVLGRARGLARLLMSGEWTGSSRGAITADGLQPSEYIEERGSAEKREKATLDWEAGVIRLKDDKVVPIEPPVLDRLSVIMQFYYKPPTADQMTTKVVGTRYVDTYVFRRLGDEVIERPAGAVTTQMWRVDYEDGEPRVELWMSPEYNWLPLKVRIHARKENGGRFATLDIGEIRVAD